VRKASLLEGKLTAATTELDQLRAALLDPAGVFSSAIAEKDNEICDTTERLSQLSEELAIAKERKGHQVE
jgi:hypothetical protein